MALPNENKPDDGATITLSSDTAVEKDNGETQSLPDNEESDTTRVISESAPPLLNNESNSTQAKNKSAIRKGRTVTGQPTLVSIYNRIFQKTSSK